MRSEQKLERQLSALEEELRTRLRDLLPEVAHNGSLLFMNSKFNPHRLNLAHLHAQSEHLLQTANSCVELRVQLGMDVAGSVADLFLAACRESADLDNAHRRGPRKLAAWLLEELSG